MNDWPTSKRSRKGRPSMTPEQQDLADELHMRALALRTASDGELSITEAVHLAAVQLGLEAPQTVTDETPD
ncbi:hypothetical protein [Streptomyces xanthophaeus]|uniref:hypothetical protein n=1 Tax=Streptomyces xanthophaeus TaxID=67385 RepID=UPI003722323B